MRFAVTFLLLFASVLTLAAQNAMRTLERVRINDSEYVRFKEWCDASGFNARWVKRDLELQATNRYWKIVLNVNSVKSYLNGTDVRLSMPVLLRNGAVLVSAIDLQTTIHPLLYPKKNPANKRIRTICLDAGHGGRDTGKIDKRHWEKTYTLSLANEVGTLLKQAGFRVLYTRTRDVTVELSERVSIANRNNADLFVSLHFNASDRRDIHGAETYCMTPAGVESSNSGGGKSSTGNYSGNAQNEQNMLFAYLMQRSVVKGTGFDDRGVKRARFEVLRGARMPAVLVEAAFMTNPEEARKIYDPAYRKRMAQSIVQGILSYQRAVETR